MQRILVPTDFSEQASNALQVAAAIARKSGAEIHLLHVVDSTIGGSFGPNTMGEPTATSMDQLFVIKLLEVNKQRMYDLANSLKSEGFSVAHSVEVGNIFTVIRSWTEDKQIDLIVMGTKGTSGLAEFLVGSNTEKVVRHSRCPVLSVKEAPGEFTVRTIVYASDFDEDDQVAVVGQLKRFQELFGANLHLVYVNVPNNFSSSRHIRERVKNFGQKYQLADYNFTVYNDTSEEEGIIHFADEIGADIIAVATHGRTGLAHLLSGSISEGVVNHARRPVLTFNLKKA
jgi:nucleotide-binding universal stress UspA family protein